MAVHNGEPYLPRAIDSILGQRFREFEFLIIDDASSDNSPAIVSSYLDERVRIIRNRKQLGLSRSLNKGIEMAKGEYIARMDHDDISLPDRLQRQSSFLDTHEDIDVVGSWAQTLELKPKTWRYPTSDEDIRSEFVFNSSLVHSSVMLRKATFDKHQLRYDEIVTRAQDYELWTRAAPQVRFANLGSVMVQYRVHSLQVGNVFGKEQQSVAERVRLREIERLGIKATVGELKLHHQVSRWILPQGRADLENLERWLLRLRAANQSSSAFPRPAFERALERRWWAACRANAGLGLKAWRIYANSRIAKATNRAVLDKLQFWLKTLLRELGWRRS